MPERCRTEVFFLPAASHVEKAGSFTQTQRMLQWREKAVEPRGDQRSELWFLHQLGRRLRELVAGSRDPRDEPLQKLAWDHRTSGAGPDEEPVAEDVLRRIGGVDLARQPAACSTTAPPPTRRAARGASGSGWCGGTRAAGSGPATTCRMAPLRVGGRVVHQVRLPWHWGSGGLVTGDVVNDLFGTVAEPNAMIQESKVASCDVRPGPRPRGAALLADVRGRAGVTAATGTRIDTADPGPDQVQEGT